MTEEVEAVYEHGVLRPLGPLSLVERQKVRLTISDTEAGALTREIEKVQAGLSSTPLLSDAVSRASAEMEKVQAEAVSSVSSYDISSVGRILPVVAHAVAVFGDEQKASHWLETPLPLLGDRSPSELLESAEGVELVEQVLTRIEHNIPS